MKKILFNSRTFAILFLVVLIGGNLLLAQPAPTTPTQISFNVLLLIPLFVGILAHWLKCYSRQQAPNLLEYLKSGLSNTITTFIGAISTLIGLVVASPAQYDPPNFIILFNVFLIGFSWDSATGGTSWKQAAEVKDGTQKP
jgi:uncharacterized membrane protein YesL